MTLLLLYLLLSYHNYCLDKPNNDKLAKPSGAIGGAAQPIYYSSDYSSPGLKACSTDSDGSHFGDIFNNYITTNWAVENYLNSNKSPTVIYNQPWNIIPVGYFSTSTSAPYCYLLSAQVALNNIAITQSHGSMYYRDTTINLPFTCSEVIPVVSAKPASYKVIGTVSSWTGSSVTVTAMCPMSATINMIFMLSIFVRTTNKIT